MHDLYIISELMKNEYSLAKI